MKKYRGQPLAWIWIRYIMYGTCRAVVYRQVNLLYKTYVNWKQHCIGNGGSYHSSTSDDCLQVREGGLRPSLKFEPCMSLRDSKLTCSKSNDNLIVHYELWWSILIMEIFSGKTGFVIVWQSIHSIIISVDICCVFLKANRMSYHVTFVFLRSVILWL